MPTNLAHVADAPPTGNPPSSAIIHDVLFNQAYDAINRAGQGVYNVLEVGTAGGGVADDSATLASADTANAGNGVTYVPPTTAHYRLGANVTLAHALRLPPAAQLWPDSGKVLTINGPFSAGPYQVFGGAGTVAFGPGSYGAGVRPEWFGTGAAAFQAAITAAESTGQGQARVVCQAGTTYTLASGVTAKRSTVVDLRGALVNYTGTSGTAFTFAGGSDWTAGGLRNGKLAGNGGTGVGVGAGSGVLGSQALTFEHLEIVGFNDGVALIGSSNPFLALFHDVRNHNNLRYGYSFSAGALENVQFVACDTFNNAGGGFVCLAGANPEIRLTGGSVDGNGGAGAPQVYCPDGATMAFQAVNTHFESFTGNSQAQIVRSDAGITSGSASITLTNCQVSVSSGTATSPPIQICFGDLTIDGGSVSAGALGTALVQVGDGHNKGVVVKVVGADLWCNTSSGTPYYLQTVTTAPVNYLVLGNECSGLSSLPVATFGSNAASVGKTDMTAATGPTGDLTMSGHLSVGGNIDLGLGSLTATSGTVDVAHYRAGGGAATITAGAQAGTGPPAITVVRGGNDVAGTVGFGTGTGPTSGIMVHVVFASAYPAIPVVLLAANNTGTMALQLAMRNMATTGFDVWAFVAPAASQVTDTYEFNYFVIGV